MKRAAASIVATAATLYLITAYDGGSSSTAINGEIDESALGDASFSNQLLGSPDTSSGSTQATTSTTAQSGSAAASSRKTVNGTSVDTGHGPLRVAIVIEGNKILSVSGTQASTSSTSKGIAGPAIPKLQTQALKAQSADIDGVSGATLTTEGFKKSLAAALSNAGI